MGQQHFGQAVKAATKRDERGDTVNNMVTYNSERKGDAPMTRMITMAKQSR